MNLTGKIKTANIDYETNNMLLTLIINEKQALKQGFDELKEQDKLSIKIEKWRQKRSLNANAFFWAIVGKIADKVGASKDEIYFEMLKRYGQSELISVVSNVPIAYYIQYYEEAGESELNGKKFTHYRVYKGSSQFNTKEMAVLIDGVVSEAQELGIPTEPPAEIERIKNLWKVGKLNG